MDEGSPAAPPGRDRETRSRLGRVLATRSSKVAAIVGGAFLAAVGGVIATRAIAFGEKATRNVFGGGDSVPLVVHALPRGELSDRGTALIPPYYIIPKSEAAGPGALSEADRRALFADGAEWSDWALRHGGVDGSKQIVLLELRARTEEPVTVTGIDVKVLDRQPRVDGWYVARPPGCDIATVRRADVDLDAPSPTMMYQKDFASHPTNHLTLTVPRSRPELVQLEVSTTRGLVEWRADVSYSGDDGPSSVPVNGGQPFRVSSEIGSEGYEGHYDPGAKKFMMHRERFWDRHGVSAC